MEVSIFDAINIDDILKYILSFIDFSSCLTLMQTCKKWNSFVKENNMFLFTKAYFENNLNSFRKKDYYEYLNFKHFIYCQLASDGIIPALEYLLPLRINREMHLWTLIKEAAINNQIQTIQYLETKGIIFWTSAILWGSKMGHLKLVKYCVSKNEDHIFWERILCHFAKLGHLKGIKFCELHQDFGPDDYQSALNVVVCSCTIQDIHKKETVETYLRSKLFLSIKENVPCK